MLKATETVLEINLNALEHNYNFLRKKLQPTTKFMGVVKAFAYGSDAAVVAKKLESLGANYFAVAYTSEGIALREAGIQLPILVLHPLAANFDSLMQYQLEPSLYSKKILLDFIAAASKANQDHYPIHFKFNTGLNRLGFTKDDVAFIGETVNSTNAVMVASLFSHLAASEDLEEQNFTLGQIQNYISITQALEPLLGYTPLRHILNTSGIINYSEKYQFDMVRSGIGLYGFGNDAAIDPQLQPIATLKTVISQINTITAGESVGYNRAFVAAETTKTATLPIGHADGIGRQYGNRNASVLINGKKAPIIGNVCMDMIMVDVSNIDCNEGDEVIVFGKGQSAEAFAATTGTISYELLCSISQRIKRVYIGG